MKTDSMTYINVEVDKLQRNGLRLYNYLVTNVPEIKDARNRIPLKLLVAHYMGDSKSLKYTKRLLLRELETVRSIYQSDATPKAKARVLLVPDVTDDYGKTIRIHQWRLKYKVAEQKNAINAVKDLLESKGMEFEGFNDLCEKVRQSIGEIDFIGPLTVYDVAMRLWYALGHDVQGTKQVRVVAGAREGLAGLIGKGKLKILLRRSPVKNAVCIDDLPNELKCMDALYIEDFLCVMHPILSKKYIA